VESRVFTQSKNKAKIEMDGMVVLSLHTDGKGSRRDEFGLWRDKLTATASNPVYVVMDPFEIDKIMYKTDYNGAIADNFADKLGKAARRFKRSMKGRTPAAPETK
jgi:hypothetical protein